MMKQLPAILCALALAGSTLPGQAGTDAAQSVLVNPWTVLAVSFDDESNPAMGQDATKRWVEMQLPDGKWVPGVAGKAFQPKSGGGAYALVAPDLANWGADSAEFYANHFHIDLWVNPDELGFQYLAMGSGSDPEHPENPERMFFFLQLEANGALTFGVDVYGTDVVTATSAPFALEAGTWKHVIASFDNKTAAIYVDGHEVARSAEDPARQTFGLILKPVSLTLGAGPGKRPEQNFRGAFDEVMFERQPVSPEKLQAK